MTKMEFFIGFIGSSYTSDGVQNVLNRWGRDGWQMTGYVETTVSGRNFFMQRESDERGNDDPKPADQCKHWFGLSQEYCDRPRHHQSHDMRPGGVGLHPFLSGQD